MNIAVVGIGYVGLAMAVLLSQRHHVTAVDIDAARVERLSRRQAPIQDADIEAYLSGCELDLTATLDAAEAYRQAARENHALLAEVGEQFHERSRTENLYAADSVHPNALGSRIAAETLASVIQKHKEN